MKRQVVTHNQQLLIGLTLKTVIKASTQTVVANRRRKNILLSSQSISHKIIRKYDVC